MCWFLFIITIIGTMTLLGPQIFNLTDFLLKSLTSLVILSVLVYLFKQRNLIYYASKIHGPTPLPLLGSAFYFWGSKKRIATNIIHLARKYKSPFKIWLGPRLVVVVTRPRDLGLVLNNALEKPHGYHFAGPLIGEGLFTGPLAKWKKHRRVIARTFNQHVLNSFVEIFDEHSHRLLGRLDSQEGRGSFDVLPQMARTAVEMICETAMGQRSIGSGRTTQTDSSVYARLFPRGMELVYRRIFNVLLHPSIIWNLTPSCRELAGISGRLEEFVNEIIDEKRRERRLVGDFEEKPRRKVFLDHLIEITDTEDDWTNEELLEEAQTMVAAGVDALGSTQSYVLLMLGIHQEIQDKVFDEIDSIFGDSSRPITVEDLNKMAYLEMVIKETLRLFPVAAVIARHADKDIRLDTCVVPRGAVCILGIIGVHRDPEIWQDPGRFDPDRFLPENVQRRPPYSFVPFSDGPRNCIGFKYAEMAMKTSLAACVRRYRIYTDIEDVDDIELLPGVVTKPAQGYPVSLQRRSLD